MKEATNQILQVCKSFFEDIVRIRRDLHMHPEIGFDVFRTADLVGMELQKLGMKVRKGIGKTGVVGDMEVPGATKRIALRADMDALPIQELGTAPYRSRVDGKGHMCGHDVHTAILIGTARAMTVLKNQLKANIRFVFQPSEESFPTGAAAMVDDGVLDGVDEIYGMHVCPTLEVGRFGICQGAATAQGDAFDIEIIGKGGHGAEPHRTIDPILIGCQYVTLLQSIVARNVDPLESAVISVTQFHGGTAFNIIPERIKLSGTVRTFKPDIQERVREKMESILAGITSSHGARYTLSYKNVFPLTYNHKECIDKALPIAEELVGSKNVVFPHPPDLGSEDFAYYSQKVPACFINLGCRNDLKGIVNFCHHPQFDVDEDCILWGMAIFAGLCLDLAK
jgi:amidohydrolase